MDFDEQMDIKNDRYPGVTKMEYVFDFIAAMCIIAFGVIAGGVL